jgi:hypothetical protein
LTRTAVCALSGEIPTSACPHRVYEWLPEGDADHAPPCSRHQRLRVDLRNGLRAGPACTRDATEERVFERWDAPYDAWARRTSRPLAPEESSPSCPIEAPEPTASDGSADPLTPRITYPFEGARFVIDPERPTELQLLDIHVEPEGSAMEVRVDGAVLPKTHAWQLAAGPHTITAQNKSGVAAPVRFSVR